MRRSAAAIAALPVVDLPIEARILRYHTGLDMFAPNHIGDHIGPREVQAECEFDLWNALQQGVI